MNEVDPIVGTWYRNLDTDTDFEVITVDEDSGTVAIQYAEGELEEIDMDAWYELALEAIDAPEDWTGPFEVDAEDLGYEEEPKEEGDSIEDF